MKATKTWVFITILIISTINVYAWPIPDTGQTKCYNNTAEIICPQPELPFYGQDGNYSINPRSYTKLGAAGATLPDAATPWLVIKDNVTGLTWENKTDDGSIHDKDNKYTWCNKNPLTNGGNQGIVALEPEVPPQTRKPSSRLSTTLNSEAFPAGGCRT